MAYFCAEYGVHNSLPLYSGGLGVLAGDHLKSASDLSLSLVAVGLLYHFGYFRQQLSLEGWQEESYGETNPEELPLHKLKAADGTPLFVEVLIRERIVRRMLIALGPRRRRVVVGEVTMKQPVARPLSEQAT